MLSPARDPYVALGVLSTAFAYETGRMKAERCRLRRMQIREGARRFTHSRADIVGTGVVMRFLLGGGVARSNARTAEQLALAQREASEFGDIVWLPMNETFYLCAWKKLLWYRHSIVHYPTARYFAIADDDSYVQLAHLEADLRTVRSASSYVLWGLIQWKFFYNRVTQEPTTGFAGWDFGDWGAAETRERAERCAAALALANNATLNGFIGGGPWKRYHDALPPGCMRLQRDVVKALRPPHSMEASPPYPFANGPLFAVSRELGELLVESHVPDEWLHALEATKVLEFYRKNGRVPHVLKSAACFPASFDAVLGRWVWVAATRRRLNITLVNTPFMIQHHPWVGFTHGAFSNRSIILHELKDPNHAGWDFVQRRGNGPFEPIERTCDSCERMGWSTVPGSPVAGWECCGARKKKWQVRQACRKRETCVVGVID